MRIIIVHSGPISEVLVASSINKGIKKRIEGADITWVVLEENKYIFKYNKKVSKVFSVKDFLFHDGEYDLFINLWPAEVKSNISVASKTGFFCHKDFDKYIESVYGLKDCLDINIFQLYFYLSGMTWRGEGCDISYYPRTRSRKNRVGMSAVNANLRDYILDNLKMDNKKIWNIPYKKNIFRRMDEINRCEKIITDDFLTLQLALFLRKYVYYLDSNPYSFNVEMFGNGHIYEVPRVYL